MDRLFTALSLAGPDKPDLVVINLGSSNKTQAGNFFLAVQYVSFTIETIIYGSMRDLNTGHFFFGGGGGVTLQKQGHLEAYFR